MSDVIFAQTLFEEPLRISNEVSVVIKTERTTTLRVNGTSKKSVRIIVGGRWRKREKEESFHATYDWPDRNLDALDEELGKLVSFVRSEEWTSAGGERNATIVLPLGIVAKVVRQGGAQFEALRFVDGDFHIEARFDPGAGLSDFRLALHHAMQVCLGETGGVAPGHTQPAAP
jgi:hypothetical protein